jgi:hypothetical protein
MKQKRRNHRTPETKFCAALTDTRGALTRARGVSMAALPLRREAAVGRYRPSSSFSTFSSRPHEVLAFVAEQQRCC